MCELELQWGKTTKRDKIKYRICKSSCILQNIARSYIENYEANFDHMIAISITVS